MSQDIPDPRAAGARGSRARLALSMGVVGSLVLGGCASIPTSGPVHVAEPPTSSTTESAEPEFAAPAPGASPEQIVTDFLAAGQGAAEDYAAARRYLAPELADSWRPGQQTYVFSGEAGIQQGLEDDQVRVSVDTRAQIDVNGIMNRQEPGSTDEFDLELTQVDGEWRISSAPDAVLIPAPNLDDVYQPYNLYFMEPGGEYAVPDPRWFPDRPVVSTQLMRALINGPAPYLDGAVRSHIPEGAELAEGSTVPIQDGEASVEMTIPDFSTADLETTQGIYGQIMLTLQDLESVDSVAMSVNDSAVELAPDEAADLPSTVASVPGRQIALRDEELVFHQGGQISPVPELADALEGRSPAAPAMSREMDQFAALADDAESMATFSSAAPRPVDRVSGSGLTDPSVDQHGWAWTADDEGAVSAASIDEPGRPALQVQADSLEGVPIASLRVSRGGTRALILTDEGDDSRILLAGIIRRGDGEPVRLNDPQLVDLDAVEPPAYAAWISDSAFVVAAERDSSSTPEVYDVSGRHRSLPTVVDGVQNIAGGDGEGEIYVESDGELLLLTGEAWSPQTDEVSDVAYAG
ncbi:LpqB family beta-propeller domain-containing protein [Kocuria palustris]|uniref:LpqB family beta-propeller domain-containing protein n=1 Tax=Kocuria palustris TaxID=71999 RepID=UPI0020434427|nr:LpqB family beta-propeller domain-containing protein [Kocuria palustris]MCM3331656.1 LpqB family beta-propeller domain-containing protein [Kocuria palustris]